MTNPNDKFTYQELLKMKAAFQMKHGKAPTRLRIGTEAFEALAQDLHFRGTGAIVDIAGLTVEIAGLGTTFDVV